MVEVTMTLSAEVYLRLMRYAEHIGMTIEDAAVTILENAFPPLLSELYNRPVTTLSDVDLLDTRDNRIDDVLSERAKWLRTWQQTSKLSDIEQIELQLWDEWYAANQARKAVVSEEITRRSLN